MMMEEDERLKKRGGLPCSWFLGTREQRRRRPKRGGEASLSGKASWVVTMENKPCKLGRAQEKEMRENGGRRGNGTGPGRKKRTRPGLQKGKKRKGKEKEGGPGCRVPKWAWPM